ncbi:hypothetical protein ARAM_006473 [Aspergillus rambellii]|uniref:Defect at low temperature protein 1 n=1 Tax=Aspergillus rambellii TaxID=308745 RepID=A0A0F8UPL9_9EURO|nr:hypothetical protein ARAM_006473 [Aspergillus rambellii]
MPPSLTRLLNLFHYSVFIVLSVALACLIVLTPADAIYQCYITQRLTNIFIITGAYVVTFLLAVLIYATRIYTNRSVLAGIPKAWIPIEKDDVGKSVRRLVKEGLGRSALIAFQARPRDVSSLAAPAAAASPGTRYTEDEEGYTPGMKGEWHGQAGDERDNAIPGIDPGNPPWGHVEHPGWSSPCCVDLPNLPYRTVIHELPNLIEAKAVSLAPRRPVLPGQFARRRQQGDYRPYADEREEEEEETIPDTRVVEILRRPGSMTLREYMFHLSSLGVVDPPEIAGEFLALYEHARFSGRELYEAEFRQLMHVFAEMLRGMRFFEDSHLRVLGDVTGTDEYTESVIGPSDEEGETDSSGSFWGIEAGELGPGAPKDPVTAVTAPGTVEWIEEFGGDPEDFQKASSAESLFAKTSPTTDGDECLHDCATCSTRYPARFDVDQEDTLYGNVDGWATHLLVATGKADWVRDVADEEGSVMEAVARGGVVAGNGRYLGLENETLCVEYARSDEYHQHEKGQRQHQPTTVMLLPGFTLIDHVTPALVPDLIRDFVDQAPTTTTPLLRLSLSDTAAAAASRTPLRSRPCPHAAVILLCSQGTRDARCGQSAPLLRREFERHLRPLGLHRDLDDDRPGGVGIYFISHVGGHKYAANVIVYRRRDFGWHRGQRAAGGTDEADDEGAAQGIWLARVRPEDCENIVRYTVLQGKVVKPGQQLRGGFDRETGLISW